MKKTLLAFMIMLGMLSTVCLNDTLYAAAKTVHHMVAIYENDDLDVGDKVLKSDFRVWVYYNEQETDYDILGTQEFDLVLKRANSVIMEYTEDKAIITYGNQWISVDLQTVDEDVTIDEDMPKKLLSISAVYEGEPVSVGGMASKRDFTVKATYRVYYDNGSTGRITETLDSNEWILLAHTIVSGKNDLTITYSLDGVKKSCVVVVQSTGTEGNWIQDGGTWRYRYDDGTYLIGDWLKSGGKWYYMDEYGYMVNRCKMVIDGATYYFDDTGVMQTGWKYMNRNWYYFDDDGKMCTGWIEVGDKWYYLDTDGIMLTGWKFIDGSWYFLDEASGVMCTGWLYRSYTWFFLDTSGVMRTGWVYTGGKWYFMDYGGAMLTNTWVGDSYVDASGAWVKSR